MLRRSVFTTAFSSVSRPPRLCVSPAASAVVARSFLSCTTAGASVFAPSSSCQYSAQRLSSLWRDYSSNKQADALPFFFCAKHDRWGTNPARVKQLCRQHSVAEDDCIVRCSSCGKNIAEHALDPPRAVVVEKARSDDGVFKKLNEVKEEVEEVFVEMSKLRWTMEKKVGDLVRDQKAACAEMLLEKKSSVLQDHVEHDATASTSSTVPFPLPQKLSDAEATVAQRQLHLQTELRGRIKVLLQEKLSLRHENETLKKQQQGVSFQLRDPVDARRMEMQLADEKAQSEAKSVRIEQLEKQLIDMTKREVQAGVAESKKKTKPLTFRSLLDFVFAAVFCGFLPILAFIGIGVGVAVLVRSAILGALLMIEDVAFWVRRQVQRAAKTDDDEHVEMCCEEESVSANALSVVPRWLWITATFVSAVVAAVQAAMMAAFDPRMFVPLAVVF